MQGFERDDAGGDDDDDGRIVVTVTETAHVWGFAVSWAFYRVHPFGSSPPRRFSVIFIRIHPKGNGLYEDEAHAQERQRLC